VSSICQNNNTTDVNPITELSSSHQRLHYNLMSERTRMSEYTLYNLASDMFNNIISINSFLEPIEVLHVLFTCKLFLERYDVALLLPSFETCLLPRIQSFGFPSILDLTNFMSVFKVSHGTDDDGRIQYNTDLEPCLSGSLPLSVLTNNFVANDMDIFIFDTWNSPESTERMKAQFRNQFLEALRTVRLKRNLSRRIFENVFVKRKLHDRYPDSFSQCMIEIVEGMIIQLIFVLRPPLEHVYKFDFTCCCNCYTASGRLFMKYPGHLQTPTLQIQLKDPNHLPMPHCVLIELNHQSKQILLSEEIEGSTFSHYHLAMI
jgi:hypothetical protein